MTLYKWSQTAAADATADASINWQEGQAPSSVNDSARAMMAATAKYRDDIAGAIVTGGTSTAYTLLSYQAFDTLAHLHGQTIAFTPHVTNGATVQLSVDSLTYKPLRSAPGVELPAGVLVQGTPYVMLYNNSEGAFYLRGFYTSPYLIPIGGSLEYWGTSVPNSSFVFPIGQAISRTTYAALFAIMGTTYGSGDGSTTFNVPDVTGRVTAMKESSATRLTSTYFGGNSTVLGAVGGSESTTLTLAQLPSLTASGNNNISVSFGGGLAAATTAAGFATWSGNAGTGFFSPYTANNSNWVAAGSMSGSNSISVSVAGTGGGGGGNASPHRTVPPTIVCNKILRII